jgi:hypothetical protein
VAPRVGLRDPFARQAIGILGISLPFLLGIGGLLTHQGLQSSISVYHHTGMRDVLR